MVKFSTYQVAISVLNMYAPDRTASKYLKLDDLMKKSMLNSKLKDKHNMHTIYIAYL